MCVDRLFEELIEAVERGNERQWSIASDLLVALFQEGLYPTFFDMCMYLLSMSEKQSKSGKELGVLLSPRALVIWIYGLGFLKFVGDSSAANYAFQSARPNGKETMMNTVVKDAVVLAMDIHRGQAQ